MDSIISSRPQFGAEAAQVFDELGVVRCLIETNENPREEFKLFATVWLLGLHALQVVDTASYGMWFRGVSIGGIGD